MLSGHTYCRNRYLSASGALHEGYNFGKQLTNWPPDGHDSPSIGSGAILSYAFCLQRKISRGFCVGVVLLWDLSEELQRGMQRDDRVLDLAIIYWLRDSIRKTPELSMLK